MSPTTPYDDVLATAQKWCDERVSSRERARVLDAGSGLESYVTFPPHVHLTGIDVSQELLDANTRLDERIHADLGTVELPERSYDCVMCWNVLEHLEDPEPVVQKLARSVADGGILLIGAPSPSSIKGLVTRLTPYAFHLWVYRRYVDAQASDAPGEGPYRTFMKRAGGLGAVRQTAERLGLTVVYDATIEAPLQQALRKRYRIQGAVWGAARVLTRVLSLGFVDAEATDYLVILQRRAAPTTRPEPQGTA
ncbi:MAG: class I SAM-dependent methyltransferase [Gaiellaceae bacterium]